MQYLIESHRASGGILDTLSSWSSFRTLHSGADRSEARMKTVLKAAASSTRQSRKQGDRGYVVVVERRSPHHDPVFVAAVSAVLRRRCVRAVAAFRHKGSSIARDGWGQLHGVIGAGALNRVRSIIELQRPDGTSRATRPTVAWGKTQMHLLLTKHQLRYERRVALDSPTRAHHFFWTKRASGDLCRWDYVLGSATAGVRRYRHCDGTVKRLQCHTNRYWDARQGSRDEDDASEDEDNGIFYDNENVDYEGCYSPLETDPVKAEELMAMSRSF